MLKKILYISVLTLFLQSTIFDIYCQSSWVLQSPYPQPNNLIAQKFFTNNTGYAISYTGNFIKTTNGGNNWTVKKFITAPNYSVIRDMDFANLNTGYVVGDAGLFYKTTNEGDNWYSVSLGITKNINTIQFINSIEGFLGGEKGTFAKTSNQGTNWSLINFDTNYSVVGVFFVNSNIGYVIGKDIQNSHRVVKTTNGGANWALQQNFPIEQFNSIWFTDENTGYIAGGFTSSRIQKTTNGGQNWLVQSTPGYRLGGIMFINSLTGYAAGASGTLIRTTNAGINWLQIILNEFETLSIVFCTDINQCYVMGEKGIIYKTIDNGNNWVNLLSGDSEDFKAITFINDNTGFAAGSNSLHSEIVKTTNSGNNWFRLYVNTAQSYFSDIAFIDANTGCVVGDNAFRTTNSGISWEWLTMPPTNSFYSITFKGLNTGYIAGGNQVLKTTDAGGNWFIVYPEGGFSLFFIDSLLGYVSGGPIKKTTNGGINWTLFPINYTLQDIYFTNEMTGYAIQYDYSNIMLKTTDGCSSWQIINTGTQGVYNSIYFTNANTGYIIGGSSSINEIFLKTTNAGLNWRAINTGINEGFHNVYFTDENTGYLCGIRGNIIKTTNAGEPIGITPINSIVPEVTSLHQNYPNPFNPITNIEFGITSNTRNENVKLTIYDLLGKEIEVLVNESLNAGVYKISFDGSSYSSGIYFITLLAGTMKITRKMVLIK